MIEAVIWSQGEVQAELRRPLHLLFPVGWPRWQGTLSTSANFHISRRLLPASRPFVLRRVQWVAELPPCFFGDLSIEQKVSGVRMLGLAAAVREASTNVPSLAPHTS